MKKLISVLLAVFVVLSMASLSVFAANIYDVDGKILLSDSGDYVYDGVRPDTILYIPIPDHAAFQTAAGASAGYVLTDSNALSDEDLFKFRYEKRGDGKSLLGKISLVGDKKLGGSAPNKRSVYLKVVVNPSTLDSEKKAELKVTFNPVAQIAAGGYAGSIYDGKFDAATSGAVNTDDVFTMTFTLWINNQQQNGADYDAAAGDQFVFSPANNELNKLVWEDVATVAFTANDDATKFFAELSTKVNESLYVELGDPVGAELYFRDFTGTPAISSTSRATLTLINPWLDDNRYQADPYVCYIYQMDADGMLSDVTGLFRYIETDEDGNEINGWQMRTRTLGYYIISDMELDISSKNQANEAAEPEKSEIVQAPPSKPNPFTGDFKAF